MFTISSSYKTTSPDHHIATTLLMILFQIFRAAFLLQYDVGCTYLSFQQIPAPDQRAKGDLTNHEQNYGLMFWNDNQ